MTFEIAILSGLALVSAFAAIVLGRNWTRSVAAGFLSLTALGFALLLSGAGFLGLVLVIASALMLGVLQVFGWMLVDVDRDHLPPTDRPTSLARGLAFLLLAGALALLFWDLTEAGAFGLDRSVIERGALIGPNAIGSLFFGPMRDVVIFLGFAVAASLLGTLLLLQDDEGNN